MSTKETVRKINIKRLFFFLLSDILLYAAVGWAMAFASMWLLKKLDALLSNWYLVALVIICLIWPIVFWCFLSRTIKWLNILLRKAIKEY